jgi:uncharacterized delta-60 repeat protein
VTTPIGSDTNGAAALVLQPDGKLVAAGDTYYTTGYDPPEAFALVRYNADGSLDGSFGTGGKVTTPIGNNAWASALVLQPDGKIVAAGQTEYGTSQYAFALVRYNANGSRDGSFGTAGKVITSIFGIEDGADALVVQPDGKLVAAGYTCDTYDTLNGCASSYFALVRYNAYGSLDSTFGAGGNVVTLIGTLAGASSLVLQPDGKLVAAGGAFTGGQSAFALVRYLNSTATVTTSTSSTTTSTTTTSTRVVSSSTSTTTTTAVPIPCCLRSSAMGAFDTCVFLSANQCAVSGIDAGSPSCSPNPCPPSTTTTTQAATSTTSSTTTIHPTGSSSSTTTTLSSSSTTTTTRPCPDGGFEGVRCFLKTAAQPIECGGDTIPQPVQRRINHAATLIDRGVAASRPTKARTFVRRAAKTMKKGVNLVATATVKGKVSVSCGGTLNSILREAEHRAEQLAASLD